MFHCVSIAVIEKVSAPREDKFCLRVPAMAGLARLMLQLNDMTRSLPCLLDLLIRHPEALIRGRTK